MKTVRDMRVSGAPFIHDSRTTARESWLVAILLIPGLGWAIGLYGVTLLRSALVAIVAALVADLLQSGLRRRFEIDDGSAFLTGILVALVLPPGSPWFLSAGASGFAILVVKGAFGGLGNNWMNPALGGVAFAWLNWPAALIAAGDPDSLTPALPGLVGLVATIDERFVSFANSLLFHPLGTSLPAGYIATMLGSGPGRHDFALPVAFALGASALLIGRQTIRWQIPATMFVSFAIPTWIFGAATQSGFFAGDPLGASLTGPFLLVAFFMATDPVTSPSRPIAILIHGGGIGLLAFLLSSLGAVVLAPVAAVLLMNAMMPLVEEHLLSMNGRREAA